MVELVGASVMAGVGALLGLALGLHEAPLTPLAVPSQHSSPCVPSSQHKLLGKSGPFPQHEIPTVPPQHSTQAFNGIHEAPQEADSTPFTNRVDIVGAFEIDGDAEGASVGVTDGEDEGAGVGPVSYTHLTLPTKA